MMPAPTPSRGIAVLLSRYDPARQRIGLALLFITLLGAGLRFSQLGAESLWYDEAMAAQHTASASLPGLLAAVAADWQQPLSYIIQFAVRLLLGEGEAALRLPSAIAGTLAIPAMYLTGRRLFGYAEGLLGAALLAVLYHPLFYSQEARAYAWLLLFSLLAVYYWLRLAREAADGRPLPRREAALYLLFSLAAAYTHYFAFLNIFWQGVALLALAGRGKQARGVFVLYALFLPGYLPWLPQLLADLRFSERPVQFGEVTLTRLSIYFKTLFNETPLRWQQAAPSVAAFLLIAAACLLWARRGWLALRARRLAAFLTDPDGLCLVWVLVPLGLTVLYSLLATPLLQPRYLIGSAPAAYFLAARGLLGLGRLRLSGRWLAALAAALAAFFLLDTLFVSDYYTAPQKSQAREAVADLLAAHAAYPDAPVVLCGEPATLEVYSRWAGAPLAADWRGCHADSLPAVEALLAERQADVVLMVVALAGADQVVPDVLEDTMCAVERNAYFKAGFVRYARRGSAECP
ncbi:MAG: glycosyltransferase family 39 protein [Chloroflexi bacterium]|nr:glycosyltransferase family 39 protein [Chloroflexota bacterium]